LTSGSAGAARAAIALLNKQKNREIEKNDGY
jgi:hypothetical protein